MCVTNIVKRRPDSAGFAAEANTPSLISQRLLGNFLPLMQNAGSACGSSSTISTGAPLDCGPQHYQQQEVGLLPPGSNNGLGLPSFVTNPEQQKPRPKRRRKPQKPGKTAKLNDRHFVVHNYHDHAKDDPDENDLTEQDDDGEQKPRRRGGVTISFPLKLHAVLDQVERDGLSSIVSWQPHGRCFVIHKPKEFVDHVMPNYFRQTKLTSFQRQLNLYGFCRLTRGKDSGGYYHELFLRGKQFLCKRMVRTKVKGTKFKAASSPEQEPDFYTMPPVLATPPTSEESSSDEGSSPTRVTRTRQRLPQVDFMFSDGLASTMDLEPVPAIDASSSGQRVPHAPAASSGFNPFRPAAASFEVPQVASRPSLTSLDSSLSPFGAYPTFGMQGSMLNPAVADSILDEAVDELFKDDPALQDMSDVDLVWDSSSFGGEDNVRDDTQLGYLLERLLEKD